MHQEACDIVRNWLDGARGINAQISAIPVADGVTIQPIEAVICKDADPSCVQGKYPIGFSRMVLVQSFGGYTLNHTGAVGVCDTKDMKIAVTYVVRNIDQVSARSETSYVLRAIRQCLLDLVRFGPDADCQSNGVVLMGGLGLQMAPLNEAADNASLMGVVVLTLQLRDTAVLPLS